MIELPQVIKDYIDSLSDVERDRVIQAQEWRDAPVYTDYRGAGCLINHANAAGVFEGNYPNMGEGRDRNVGVQFDRIFRWHGAKAIAAIKAYAARNNRAQITTESNVHEPQNLS